MRSIDKQKRDYAYRLFQCLVVSKRPLLVKELAELFAIQPNAEALPAFDANLRPENPEEFILSACSTLVAVVNVGHGDEDQSLYEDVGQNPFQSLFQDEDQNHEGLYQDEKIVQFSHFSVREYLISDRIAISEHVSGFRILPRPAHALLAGACLSVLLQLDDHIVRDEDQNTPLVLYAAQYWIDHARFEDVSSDIHHGMKLLFDRDKPYFVAWLQLHDVDTPSWYSIPRPELFPAPLYYAALCGFRDIAAHLLDTHSQDASPLGGSYWTPLHAALDNGHLSVAILLLARGAAIGAQDSQGQTPLHIASHHGYTEVISLLLDRGADPNAETKIRETPLCLASKYGRQDAARLLLERSADANSQSTKGLTPLRAAWQEGHIDIVRLLLDHGANAKSPDNRGKSPLHVVLQEGRSSDIGIDPEDSSLVKPNPAFLKHRLDVVMLLLEHGADADYPDYYGKTPLHIALRGGVIDVAQLLLHHGANPNHPDNYGDTPLHITSQSGFIDSVQLLLNHGAEPNHPGNYGETPLHSASQGGFTDVVRLLLHHGADPNHPDNFGTTPLRDALQMGHDEIIRLLIDLLGNDCWPSLHAASHEGHDKIVGSLLNHGVDANYPDSDGWTALHAASQEGHDNIVRLLLDHGADANRSDSDDWTSLHAASQGGHDTVVRLLLDHGADTNRSDNDGWSSLHAASQEGHESVVRLLLDHGAIADHPDHDGWTPIHAASQRGHDRLVRLLLDHGAAPNRQDNRGRTPLHVAWKKNNGLHPSSYLLLHPDAGANSPGSDGWTLLRQVSKRGDNNVVRLLLKHGADANQPDNDGLTPLRLALRAGAATMSTNYDSVTAQR